MIKQQTLFNYTMHNMNEYNVFLHFDDNILVCFLLRWDKKNIALKKNV